jgi:hypothetical protein
MGEPTFDQSRMLRYLRKGKMWLLDEYTGGTLSRRREKATWKGVHGKENKKRATVAGHDKW